MPEVQHLIEKKEETKDPYKDLKDIHAEAGIDFEVVPSKQYTYSKFRLDFAEEFLHEDVLFMISTLISFVNQPMLKDSFKKSEERSAFASKLEPTLKKQHGENKLKVNRHLSVANTTKLLLSFLNEKPEDRSLDKTRKLCNELVNMVYEASPETTAAKPWVDFDDQHNVKEMREKLGWKVTTKIVLKMFLVKALAKMERQNKLYFTMSLRRKIAYVNKLDKLCRNILASLEVPEEPQKLTQDKELYESLTDQLNSKVRGRLGTHR